MRRAIYRLSLTCLLQSAGLSLALMTASAVGVRAQTVIGADGAPGVNCDLSDVFCLGGNGGDGESVTIFGSPSAAAYGGNGGQGGLGASFSSHDFENDGYGGSGGSATAVAEASAASGAVTASAMAVGGSAGGGNYHGGGSSSGGASASASASSGDVTVSAMAMATGFVEPGGIPLPGATVYAFAEAFPYGNIPDAEGDIVFGIAKLTDDDGFFFQSPVASFDLGGYRGDVFVNGSDLGPAADVGLMFFGSGTWVISGTVPEPSTWAMMLIGFVGLGFAGYRASRRRAAPACC